MTRFPATSTAVASASITRHVRLVPEHPADRRGDVGRAERGGRHLVEQRLEEVMVRAVDDRDPHGCAAQPARRRHAAEPRPDDTT